MATAPIRPLTWEPPYAAGAALKKDEKTKKKKKSVKGAESVDVGEGRWCGWRGMFRPLGKRVQGPRSTVDPFEI